MNKTAKQRLVCALHSLLLILLLYSGTEAQIALYDNTHLQLHLGERLIHPHVAQRFAQPFWTDALNSVITSINLPIGRVGTPQGEVLLSIWDDNEGVPGKFVSEVGLLTALELLPSIGPNASSIEQLAFEPTVPSLTPSSTYYLVVDLSDTTSSNGIMNNVGNGAVFPSEGTNGAGTLLVHLRGNMDWFDVGDVTGTSAYLQMSITAVRGALSGDFDNDGAFTTADIDQLSNELRAEIPDVAYDVNGDGQITIDDHAEWIHSSVIANTYFGDSNLNGEFDSSDLTIVFSAGEYEDDITLNSTWAEGDWNGDGDFDSGDLILAFQDGGYEQGPKSSAQAVPEPSTMLLTLSLPVAIGFVRRMRCSTTLWACWNSPEEGL